MRVGAGGWLVAESGGVRVVRLPTVRTYALSVPAPLGLIWHTTGGLGGPRWAEALARRIQTYRRGVDRAASWHLLIAKDGTIYQSAPLDVGTWHVGRPGVIGGRQFANINRATIGVELENTGPLTRRNGEYYAWPYWIGTDRRQLNPRMRIDPSRVRKHGGMAYDGYPEEQVASAREMVVAIANHFHLSRAALSYSHAQFAAPRKVDPGPLWMEVELPRVLDALGGDYESEQLRA